MPSLPTLTTLKRRLCFAGPMLGRNEGWVTSQGEILADQFSAEGWEVRETSSLPSRPARLVDTISCLVRWRSDVDVAVVLVFSGPSFVMADLTSLLTKLLGIPTVLWLHGGSLPDFRRRYPRWVKRVLRRGALVAPSQFLVDEMAPVAPGPIEVIPNVVDLASLPFRPRTTVQARLLWMRAFHPIYNPSMAIRALRLLLKQNPDVKLTLAGQDKGLGDELRSEISDGGLAESATIAGFLGPDAKPAAFANHDIYLHTNHVDNTPVSVLEAASAGLAIVATNVGGIPHLLEHEETALLVDDDDDQAMAAAVERLLSDPELAQRLTENALRLAEASAWPAVRQRWVELLEGVVV